MTTNAPPYAREHSTAYAAASLPGRSAVTSGKSVSSIKGHLRQLVNADLVWIDELGIHITALEPERTPIVTQPPFPDLDEARTLDIIATDIKAAADRGDFAAVAQLAAEADTLRERDAAAVPAEVNEGASSADVPPDDESKNCPDRVKKLPHVKREINPSVVSQQNLLNPRQVARAACRPHGGDGGNIRWPPNRTPIPIPDTDATRLLQRYGVRSPAALCNHSAAPLAIIEHARRRQLELDAGPGMIVQILDDNGLVWKSGGKHVDNSLVMPALDDEAAWRDRYIGGDLGRYIIGGPTDAPPAVNDAPPEPERARRDAEHALINASMPPALRPPPTPPEAPPDDPELRKYRNNLSVPPWMREGGDA